LWLSYPFCKVNDIVQNQGLYTVIQRLYITLRENERECVNDDENETSYAEGK
jgi:hypothetical protein